MNTPHSLLHNDGILCDLARDLVFRLTDASVTDLGAAVAALKAKNMDRPRAKLADPAKAALAGRVDELLPLFAGLGLTGDILDIGTTRHTLLLGARFTAIVKRMAVLGRAVDRGFAPGTMHLLSGIRPLDPDEMQAVEALQDCSHHPFLAPWEDALPTHEGGLLEGLWLRAELATTLRSAPYRAVAVEDPKANTHATLGAWLATSPAPGRVVVVTGPGRSYQARVAQAVLGKVGWTNVGSIAYQGDSDVLSATEALSMELESEAKPIVL